MKTERRLSATPRELDGVLLLDKPAGRSSTQAMSAAKRIFRVQKAGHTGTLDPFATGLLPVCFGEATKFSRFMLDAEKSYRATLKLGEVSTTGDTEGVIQRSGPVEVDGARAAAVLEQFVGEQTQIPPMYSALKQAGVPLYELARKGIEVERAARHIHIYAIELISLSGSELVIDVDVSKGTYIRVLAEDIGKQLGCGAHLTALRRTATGGFRVADAVSLDTLEAANGESLETFLRPPSSLCTALPAIILDVADEGIFSHGGWVGLERSPNTLGEHAVFNQNQRFLGVGVIEQVGNKLRLSPSRVMKL
ncbi:MAG: tRNA pseudouridine(55) synthase TruB [Rhodocyclaceae bacterium]|nr:tRNA pseudouridine(55) synthase TruB [Rhodocyclaceae bacterium]